MTTRAHIKASLLGIRNSDAVNYTGGMRAEAAFELVFGDGTADLQINRVHDGDAVSIPTGAGVDFDLQALASAGGETLDAVKIKGLWIQADSLNDVALMVTPGAADPWLGLMAPGSGFGLRAGELGFFVSAVGWDVSPTSKILNIAHGGGSAQTVKIAIIASTV